MKHITTGVYSILLFLSLTIFSYSESYKLNFNYVQYANSLNNIVNKLSHKVHGANLRETLYKPNSIYASIDVVEEHNISATIIIRIADLAMQGFVTKHIYYYFSNATVKMVTGANKTKRLPFSSNYQDLRAAEAEMDIETIDESIIYLASYQGKADLTTQLSLVRVMYITTEAMRFKTIYSLIAEDILQEFATISWQDTSKIINDWQKLSAQAYFLKESEVINIAESPIN